MYIVTGVSVDELWSYHLQLLKKVFESKNVDQFNRDFFTSRNLKFDKILQEIGHIDMDDDLQIIAAYPLSLQPNDYKIKVSNIGEGHAMCAIDALGVPYTFNVKTLISAIDNSTGKQIELIINPKIDFNPPTHLYISYKENDPSTQAITNQCPELNFYSDPSDIDKEKFTIYSFSEALEHAKKRFSINELKKMTRSHLEE